ncbi:hypothetical protein C8J56DRAFT_896006 [Mycena floridula]|nr:hypothetical protein C8J56DRAFT_896006 [Mycena floridula]
MSQVSLPYLAAVQNWSKTGAAPVVAHAAAPVCPRCMVTAILLDDLPDNKAKLPMSQSKPDVYNKQMIKKISARLFFSLLLTKQTTKDVQKMGMILGQCRPCLTDAASSPFGTPGLPTSAWLDHGPSNTNIAHQNIKRNWHGFLQLDPTSNPVSSKRCA